MSAFSDAGPTKDLIELGKRPGHNSGLRQAAHLLGRGACHKAGDAAEAGRGRV